MELANLIRDIPNFPKQGIIFKDITPLLGDPQGFRRVVDAFLDRYSQWEIDAVAGIEARGFLFAAPVAHALGKPLVPIRKQGKLPGRTRSIAYALEYGTGVVEMHEDALPAGSRVVIMDDLLATGGTLGASAKLIEEAGCEVAELSVLIELKALEGRQVLKDYQVFSLLEF
ncbi:MAG: adenine phosphoribosyltransferase [SAR202 cluster bacterium]|nr:adenine phosphoribosyltransferase [SAR202 cluster bacterium]